MNAAVRFDAGARALPRTTTARAPRRPGALGARLLQLGFAAYVLLLVAAPLAAVVWRAASAGPSALAAAIAEPAAVAAVSLSIWTSLLAAAIQAVVGTAIAWWLVRWDLPGTGFVRALVDLPLAVPTLVAGIVLVALYGPHTLVGGALADIGVTIAFARPGIVLALLFVTLPMVVRTVEPVLRELDPAEEEAAMLLGASRLTVLRRVLLPPVFPAIAAGTVQVFARSVAEFGSIAVVSGNLPYKTLTAPVYVLGEVEAGDTAAAAAVSVVLLAAALALDPIARALLARSARRRGDA